MSPFADFASAFTMTSSTEDACDDSIAPSMKIGTFWLEETAIAVSIGPGCGKTFNLNKPSFKNLKFRLKDLIQFQIAFT